MPSCAPAIISETFSIAVERDPGGAAPRLARGSIALRRAEISANSAPTKKALSASRTASADATRPVLTRPRPSSSRPGARASRTRSTRSPSIAITVSVTSSGAPSWSSTASVTLSPAAGMRAELVADQARRPSRSPRPRAAATPTCRRPRPAASGRSSDQLPSGSRRAGLLGLVVLVADLADDLLDEVLERHEPVDVAELVDDDAPSAARRARSVVEQVVELEARRAPAPARPSPRATGDVAAVLERARATACLTCTIADDVVALVGHDREPGAAARARRSMTAATRARPRRRSRHPHARRHDLVARALAERQRALQQRRGPAARACPARPSGARARRAPRASAPTPAPPAARSRSGAGSRSRCR